MEQSSSFSFETGKDVPKVEAIQLSNCSFDVLNGVFKNVGPFGERDFYQSDGTGEWFIYFSKGEWRIRQTDSSADFCMARVRSIAPNPALIRQTWQLWDMKKRTFAADRMKTTEHKEKDNPEEEDIPEFLDILQNAALKPPLPKAPKPLPKVSSEKKSQSNAPRLSATQYAKTKSDSTKRGKNIAESKPTLGTINETFRPQNSYSMTEFLSTVKSQGSTSPPLHHTDRMKNTKNLPKMPAHTPPKPNDVLNHQKWITRFSDRRFSQELPTKPIRNTLENKQRLHASLPALPPRRLRNNQPTRRLHRSLPDRGRNNRARSNRVPPPAVPPPPPQPGKPTVAPPQPPKSRKPNFHEVCSALPRIPENKSTHKRLQRLPKFQDNRPTQLKIPQNKRRTKPIKSIEIYQECPKPKEPFNQWSNAKKDSEKDCNSPDLFSPTSREDRRSMNYMDFIIQTEANLPKEIEHDEQLSFYKSDALSPIDRFKQHPQSKRLLLKNRKSSRRRLFS